MADPVRYSDSVPVRCRPEVTALGRTRCIGSRPTVIAPMLSSIVPKP